jgi:tetratricopeptide (TPR) repeat protein
MPCRAVTARERCSAPIGPLHSNRNQSRGGPLLRLAAALLVGLVLAWGQTAPQPFPRNPAEAENLEQQLLAHPGDAAVRAQLIRFYSRTRSVTDKSRILRGQHILWMIEHDSANPLLGEPAGTIDPQGHPFADAYAYAQADRAWRSVLNGPAATGAAFANAVWFYRSPDPAFSLRIAGEGLTRFPKDARLGTVAGSLYALAIVGGTAMDGSGTAISVEEGKMRSPEALAARRQVESSPNAALLGAVTQFLMQQMPALRATVQAPQLKGIFDFAARCYEHAIAIEPGNASWTSGLRTVYRTAAAMPARPGDRIVYLERAARVPATDAENLSLLPELALARLEAGDTDKAAEAAREALRLAETRPGPTAANAVHYGNIALGRLALKAGRLDEAKARLLAAGRTTGSVELGAAGPDWRLASDLLAKGEKTAVLDYIELCRVFWRRDGGRLDVYATSIRAGEWPFGKR